MTTIEEEGLTVSSGTMNEFFNFEDATHPDPKDIDLLDFSSGPHNLDPAFADDNVDGCLEHFNASFGNPISPCSQNTGNDQDALVADDFTNFPRWIDGMNLPTNPCSHCYRMSIHCKVIREGLRKGSCTSCVALARSCSLTHNHFFGTQRPVDALTAPEHNEARETACVYCRRRGLQCVVVTEEDKSCANCIAFACPCSLNTNLNKNSLLEDLPATRPIEQESSSQVVLDANPKIGARFSRESLRILRNWLSTHHSHPYPTDDEKDVLMKQTGLNKTQVTNWLANARRRHKIRPPRASGETPRSASPGVLEPSYVNGIDIPRRATPALENMNPLERWKHSPPEHDPASLTDIAKAVSSSTLSSGRESPYTRYGRSSDDGSARSICNVSSTSSLGTSGSSGSFASAFSHRSYGSFGSFGTRGRRRRRKQAPKPVKISAPGQLPATIARTYQCTFCTETFKTKHDWQRHEKTLHLSLERWICCPTGFYHKPTESGCPTQCVFCGAPNPTAEHAEEHNFSSCIERTIEERTFYRKDHLRQHLNLVHDVKFQAFAMESWKVATPEIRSRCGFCGLVMDSWSIRVDHLADHFKGGKSMKDWKGDWGFDAKILDLVENGLPPYLIHDERNSMNPFEASKNEPADEKKLDDTIKIGLVDFIHDRIAIGKPLTDEVLLAEARNIIEQWKVTNSYNDSTWFCDLFLLWGTEEAEPLDPSETFDSSRSLPWETITSQTVTQGPTLMLPILEIACFKQRALLAFVKQKESLGLIPTDQELQAECCRILDDAEKTANFKCRAATDWMQYLIRSSSSWLRNFRRHAKLPRSSEMKDVAIRSNDEKSIDHSILNKNRLEVELGEWVNSQLAMDRSPTDNEIQHQARMIVYQNDDPWNQTAADDPAMLCLFKRQIGLVPTSPGNLSADNEEAQTAEHTTSPEVLHWDLEQTGINIHWPSPGSEAPPRSAESSPTHRGRPGSGGRRAEPLKYFLNDVNCYGRLVRELNRFVKLCMNPSNPESHIPTDTEIQNHARLVIYCDTDPWNQTAADNAEWRRRFKRDVGLIPSHSATNEALPGLPEQALSWDVRDGGSGFSPPFVMPGRPEKVSAKLCDDGGFVLGGGLGQGPMVEVKDKTYLNPKAVRGFVKDLPKRFAKPGVVFCSRDLENGLKSLVDDERCHNRVPSDEQLRARARQIMKIDRTAADDETLLAKFKETFLVASASSRANTSSTSPKDSTAPSSIYHPQPRLPTIHQSGPGPFTSAQIIPISAADKTQQLEAAFDAELFGHLPQYLDMGSCIDSESISRSSAECKAGTQLTSFPELQNGSRVGLGNELPPPTFRTGTQLSAFPESQDMDWTGDFNMDIDNFDVMNDSGFDGIDFCGAPSLQLGMTSGLDGDENGNLDMRQQISQSDQKAFREFMESQGTGEDGNGKGWEFEGGGSERIW